MTDSNPAFKLDPSQTAIVVIDLQKGILAFRGDSPEVKSVLANAARLLTAARSAGAKPVLVHVGFSPDGADRLNPPADQAMRSASVPPPDWTDFVPELDQQPSDLTLFKHQWGAFYGTDLDLQLRRRHLTTIVLCGIATEIGVESTARFAYEFGYELVFASDAMSGISPEGHANSIERIFPRMGRVRTTTQIIAALQP
jgi:nicotinamidase-related amidase